MTHIDNIPHIHQYGLTHSTSENRNSNYKPIGDNSIISSRSSQILFNHKILGDYIPFYFGSRMPMLYVIQKGYNDVPFCLAEDIVYCITSVAKMLHLTIPFIFTDGHAVNSLSVFFDASHINKIEEILDFSAIKEKWWNDSTDVKRRKEAEFLVENDIPPAAILGYAVFNEGAKAKLEGMGIASKQIVIKPEYYF